MVPAGLLPARFLTLTAHLVLTITLFLDLCKIILYIYIYKRRIGCVSIPDGRPHRLHQLNLNWHIDSHYPWEGYRQVR